MRSRALLMSEVMGDMATVALHYSLKIRIFLYLVFMCPFMVFRLLWFGLRNILFYRYITEIISIMDPGIILQWNLKSIRRKKSELLHLINKFHPSILAISESWLVPGSSFRVPGYSCLRHDRADGYAGCALLVRRSLPFFQVSLPPISPNINIVAAKVFDITFLSIYIPHPHCSLTSDISLILSSVPHPLILLGDLNAHHTSWGSSHIDTFALSLLDVFDVANLCVVNDGSPTRRAYPTQNPKSAVDLTICSASLASLISWSVLPLSYGSDHFPIIVSIPNKVSPFRNFHPSLKYRLLDSKWSSYASSFENKLVSLPSPIINNVVDCYSKFTDAMLSSADENFPIKKPRNFIVSTPWWDAECTAAIEDRKNAENAYNVSMTKVNFLSYQKSAAKASRILSKKKRLGWIRVCENLSPRTPACLVWKLIKRFRGSFNSCDVSANDPSSWLEGFSNKMSPPSVPYFDAFPSLSGPLTSHDNFDSSFSSDELRLALDGLVDSSPGMDGIPYSFIKNATDECKEYFLMLINIFFENGIVPEQWKTQVVIPILKPGKSPSDPNSYRPIALSPVLSKVVEHMIKNRLEWIVENKKILAKSQFGFRKGMSTIDSLSILTTDIRIALLKKEYLVGVFLDIASAYDNVLLPVLKNKLLLLNIPEKMVRFISNLLMERTIYIKNCDKLFPPRTVWKGLPQGSVLSPLLYSIYTHDLENSVNSFCEILQYADDLALYVTVKSTEEASQRLSVALAYLHNWLLRHGLSLSASKSSVVVFTKKRHIPPVVVRVNDEVIPQENIVKFLGIWLESRLSGSTHCDYVVQKCERNINVLRSLSGVWWGAHPFSQKILYNAIIRSHMDYGLFLLDPSTKTSLNKLDKIQYKCLRIILGAMKSSPTNALQVECVDPPLALRRQFLANRFFFKLVQNSDHPLIAKLHQLSLLYNPLGSQSSPALPCLLRSYLQFSRLPNPLFQCSVMPLYSTLYDALVFQPNVILDFGVDKNTLEVNRIFNDITHSDYNNWLHIYTDASKVSDSGSVGAAVWIPSTRIILSYKCPPVTSVFTGESVAILAAILFVKSHNIANSIIFSDSKSCLQSIISNPFRSKSRFPIILKIRLELYYCYKRGINITLAWIPGHSGIPGNESVDSCARNAIDTGSDEYSKIYSHDMCTTLKPLLFDTWNKGWQISRSIKGQFYGDIQPEVPMIPWFSKYRLADKTTTSTICRLRLNHCCTPVFLNKIRIRDSSICECGLDEGNVNHLFFSCPNMRFSLYDCLPSQISRPVSFKHLLSLIFTRFTGSLCKYIVMNKIKL